MESIYEKKKQLRRLVKERKQQLTQEEITSKSEAICEAIECHPSFKQATTIMAYWSMSDEVQLQAYIPKWAKEKRIILPCVNKDELVLKVFEGVENLHDGDLYGIPEPKGEEFKDVESIDLIIVPGVAFDKQNNRMGRGKAYYDKLLRHSYSQKIGICFNIQYFDEVPYDELDVKMNEVIYA
ncbi:MAG: 5-formyltetrahydrofolate cyclo-ligase [Hyphomicrobiales bacterium]